MPSDEPPKELNATPWRKAAPPDIFLLRRRALGPQKVSKSPFAAAKVESAAPSVSEKAIATNRGKANLPHVEKNEVVSANQNEKARTRKAKTMKKKKRAKNAKNTQQHLSERLNVGKSSGDAGEESTKRMSAAERLTLLAAKGRSSKRSKKRKDATRIGQAPPKRNKSAKGANPVAETPSIAPAEAADVNAATVQAVPPNHPSKKAERSKIVPGNAHIPSTTNRNAKAANKPSRKRAVHDIHATLRRSARVASNANRKLSGSSSRSSSVGGSDGIVSNQNVEKRKKKQIERRSARLTPADEERINVIIQQDELAARLRRAERRSMPAVKETAKERKERLERMTVMSEARRREAEKIASYERAAQEAEKTERKERMLRQAKLAAKLKRSGTTTTQTTSTRGRGAASSRLRKKV